MVPVGARAGLRPPFSKHGGPEIALARGEIPGIMRGQARKPQVEPRMSSGPAKTTATTARVPLFQGILPLDRSKLVPEIVAGITLAALGIPEVMGYTKIIGTPVITGLYTLLLPVLAFAIFGSSRHLVVAADSATAAMVSAALASYAGGPQYVALTSLVALVAGGLLLLARVLRLGFLADFLSRTVLVGFLSGVGAQVALAELPGVLGLENGGEGFWGHLFFTAKHLREIDPASVSIALCVLATIVAFERFAPRFPGALLAVAATIAASAMFHWGNHGIKLVGDVPADCRSLGLPNVAWNDVPLVLPIAFSCCIVILAQSAATSRAYAFRYGERFGEDTDLVGLAARQPGGRTERHVRRQRQPDQNGHGRYGGRSQPDRASRPPPRRSSWCCSS